MPPRLQELPTWPHTGSLVPFFCRRGRGGVPSRRQVISHWLPRTVSWIGFFPFPVSPPPSWAPLLLLSSRHETEHHDIKRNRSTYRTGFLPPPDVNVMLKLLDPLLDVEAQAWGGHEQVGRQLYRVGTAGTQAGG